MLFDAGVVDEDVDAPVARSMSLKRPRWKASVWPTSQTAVELCGVRRLSNVVDFGQEVGPAGQAHHGGPRSARSRANRRPIPRRRR